LSSGKEFAKRFLNRTFKLDYTEMYIDEAGERRTNLVVRDLNFTSGNYTVSLLPLPKEYSEEPHKTQFQVNLLQDKARSTLRVVNEIEWGSDGQTSPPLNEPACGYQGNRNSCHQTGNYGEFSTAEGKV
jgi:hypothetical protein